jgi:hypothetical protein
VITQRSRRGGDALHKDAAADNSTKQARAAKNAPAWSQARGRHHSRPAFNVHQGGRGAVAWIDEKVAANARHLSSFDPDGNRASELLHAVQDKHGDANLCGTTPVRAKP